MTEPPPVRPPWGPIGLLISGMVSVQVGSALAATLFRQVGPSGAAMLRLVIGAAVMLLFCRPRVRGYTRADWWAIAAFGTSLGCMNLLFYQALDRLPLGVAVTIEVLGPLALSVWASRRLISVLWATLALAGVALLGSAGFDRLPWDGVALALGAGAMWAAYILASARVGGRFPKVDGLALAMAITALISVPFGVVGGGTALLRPGVLLLGAGVAVLSSVLPYSLELVALRRMPAATFAVLMSVEPAVAAGAGWLVLRQRLSWWEIAGMVLVMAASVGAVRVAPPAPAPA